jgi:hypothetical protein
MNETKNTMNLLESFAMRHTQVSHLEVSLKEVIPPDQRVQAKVELNLTPRELKTNPSDGGTAYQVTARMQCQGFAEGQESGAGADTSVEPLFKVLLVMHVAYRQFQGVALSFQQFSQHHTSLARQIYPLVHQQVKPILQQLGLHTINLPYDLVDIQPVVTPNTGQHSVLH